MPAKFQFDQTEAVTSVRPAGQAAYPGSRPPPPPPGPRAAPPPYAGGDRRRKKLIWAIVGVGIVGLVAVLVLVSVLRSHEPGTSRSDAATVHAGSGPSRGGDHRRRHHEEKHHTPSRPSSGTGGGGVPPAFSP